MSSLYELTAQYRCLLDLAMNPETDPQLLYDTMEALTGEIEAKADAYGIIIKELEADRDKRLADIARQKKFVDSDDSNIKRLKANLFLTMQDIGVKKLTSEHFKFSIAKNGGKTPLEFLDEVPHEWAIPKWSPDNEKIREALDNGEELPFVKYGEKGSHLNIR